MKNYLIIILLACSTFVSAQSLKLLYQGESITDTIPIVSNLSGYYYFDMVNVSTNDISLKWESETSLVSGSDLTFCGLKGCTMLTNGTDEGPQMADTLFAGDTMKGGQPEFYIGYNPNGAIGTSYLKLTFSDITNPFDNATVIFKFVSGTVGICDPDRQTVQTFETYPNPASSAVFVKYGLNKEYSNVEFVLHSLTGSVIKTIPANASENTVRIDVEDLAQGIYFCSLKVDGIISSSKKIAVTK
jgi:hypothetical protein